MYKRLVSSFMVISILFCSSNLWAIKAECLNTKGKFSNCEVIVSKGLLEIDFKSKTWDELDIIIPGDRITGLSSGEYARRRVAESIGSAVLLGPLFLFVLFSKKKRDCYGVEYLGENKMKDAVMIQVKKKYSHALATQLRMISGKEIETKSDEDVDKKKNGEPKNEKKTKKGTKHRRNMRGTKK